MSDSDEIVNEILQKTKPGFRKATSRPKEDAVKSRAKAQGQSRDLSYVRAKLAPKADATVPQPDAADIILDIMGSKRSTFAPMEHRDTRIVKIENDEGQKTRAVLDVTGKKKIGEAS